MSLFSKLLGKSKRLDFSEIIHVADAREFEKTGALVAINPMPIEFGGVTGPLNTAYIPSSAVEKFDQTIARLRQLAEAGEIDSLRIKQDHRGASIIPTRLYFSGALGDQEGLFNLKIDIW